METIKHKSINSLMNEAVKSFSCINETLTTFESVINGQRHIYKKNKRELIQSGVLAERAFIAGRSKTSWRQFVTDNK